MMGLLRGWYNIGFGCCAVIAGDLGGFLLWFVCDFGGFVLWVLVCVRAWVFVFDC